MAELLETINGRLAAIGAIVTGIVALNSALTTCSSQTIARYGAFRGAVSTEENYWRDRFTDYTQIMQVKDEADRRRRLWGLAALAQHEVPDFAEYQWGMFTSPNQITRAKNRLEGMRATLTTVLRTGPSSDPEVAKALNQSSEFEKSQAEISSKAAIQAPAPDKLIPVESASSAIDYSEQILSRGKPNGWDIDVFWCAGGGQATERENYSVARAGASRLAALSSANKNLTRSVPLGQIRLAPLPLLKQGGNYPVAGSGNTIQADSTPSEQTVAEALVKLFGDARPTFSISPNAVPSEWYLSVFVCRAATPSALPGSAATAP